MHSVGWTAAENRAAGRGFQAVEEVEGTNERPLA